MEIIKKTPVQASRESTYCVLLLIGHELISDLLVDCVIIMYWKL